MKFFDAISRHLPGDPLMGGDAGALSNLDPDKMYVENVRAALRVSERRAKLYCETAVRQGVFDRWVEAIAPDDTVVVSAPSIDSFPAVVRHWVEHNGQLEEMTLNPAQLQTRIFYRLHR
jgi:hypothetical protein